MHHVSKLLVTFAIVFVIAVGGYYTYRKARLSLNGTISCAICHIPEQGFTNNELRTPIGLEGRTVRRNAISVYNSAYQRRLFHDGRETRLEHQVWGPLLAANEMGNPSIGAVVEKLRQLRDYHGLFEVAFPGEGLGMRTIGMALASYQRTLVSGDSPFDRWYYGHDDAALGGAAKRGFGLFAGRAGCSGCHTVGEAYALFSDGELHNTGVGYAATMLWETPQRVPIAPGLHLTISPDLLRQVSEPRPSDLGAYEITQRPADRWKYKTPGLRNVALTAPYMHDGSLSTLEAVVDFYARGGVPNEALDPGLHPLDLDTRERADLTAFLASLTGSDVAVLVQDGFAVPVGAPAPTP